MVGDGGLCVMESKLDDIEIKIRNIRDEATKNGLFDLANGLDEAIKLLDIILVCPEEDADRKVTNCIDASTKTKIQKAVDKQIEALNTFKNLITCEEKEMV